MIGDASLFDALLREKNCTTPASVFDPLTGRMAEELGYSCAVLPGSSVALHHLGVPDVTLTTSETVVDLCRRITRVMTIPLIVDGDHGFGNAINARRFTEDLVMAGAAAVTIEDTCLPRPLVSGVAAGIPLAEACAKIQAAVDGAGGRLHVIARTSTAVCPDVPSLIERLRAFEQTGASALFISGLKDWATLEAAMGAIRLPLILGARAQVLEDMTRLSDVGVRIALACRSVSMASYRGAWDRLAADAPNTVSDTSMDFPALIDRLSGGPAYREQADRYSITEDRPKTAGKAAE